MIRETLDLLNTTKNHLIQGKSVEEQIISILQKVQENLSLIIGDYKKK